MAEILGKTVRTMSNRIWSWKRLYEPAIAIAIAVPLAVPAWAQAPVLQPVGGITASADQGLPDNPAPVPQEQQTTGNGAQQQDQKPPLGTAAAPVERPLGTPASSPAGAVIAPAKQKRARYLVLKVGLIVAGAVAIGTVVALSEGSPSHSH